LGSMRCELLEESKGENADIGNRADLVNVLSKRCVWNIVRILSSSKSNMMNITALVASLRANYDYVMKCLNLMMKFGMVEVAKIGRLRLVKLNTDNEIVAKMIAILGNATSS